MDEILEAGERRINLLRGYNASEGIGKSADVLPKKLFEPLGGKGPTAVRPFLASPAPTVTTGGQASRPKDSGRKLPNSSARKPLAQATE